ncbi:MGLL, partial [Symbiodinium pilosum]
ALRTEGFAAIAYDQVGSGYSEGDAPGYVESFGDVITDLQKLAEEEQKRYPSAKIFALGESAGALVALRHGIGRAVEGLDPSPIAGYILCGPIVRIKKEMMPPPCVIGIAKFLARFFPKLPLPGVDVTSTFDEAFGDPRWAAAGKADPVVQRVINAQMHVRTGAESLGAMEFINLPENQKKFKAPIAMIIGEKEVRVDLGAAFEFYMTAGSDDKYLKVLKGARHQLFQDQPELIQVAVQEVISWLKAHA